MRRPPVAMPLPPTSADVAQPFPSIFNEVFLHHSIDDTIGPYDVSSFMYSSAWIDEHNHSASFETYVPATSSFSSSNDFEEHLYEAPFNTGFTIHDTLESTPPNPTGATNLRDPAWEVSFSVSNAALPEQYSTAEIGPPRKRAKTTANTVSRALQQRRDSTSYNQELSSTPSFRFQNIEKAAARSKSSRKISDDLVEVRQWPGLTPIAIKSDVTKDQSNAGRLQHNASNSDVSVQLVDPIDSSEVSRAVAKERVSEREGDKTDPTTKHGSENPREDSLRECHFCLELCGSATEMQQHWRTTHQAERPVRLDSSFRCRFDVCRQSCANLDTQIRHEKTHLPIHPTPTKPMCNVIAGPYPLMCRVIKCMFCTWDIDKLGDHLFGSHHSEGPLQHSPAELHAQYLDFEAHINQLGLLELNRVWMQQKATLECRFEQCSKYFRSVPARIDHEKSHICGYPGCEAVILISTSGRQYAALRDHWSQQHARRPLYLCPNRQSCCKAFCSIKQRDQHCWEEHRSHVRHCPIPHCSQLFVTRGAQGDHLYSTHSITAIDRLYPEHTAAFERSSRWRAVIEEKRREHRQRPPVTDPQLQPPRQIRFSKHSPISEPNTQHQHEKIESVLVDLTADDTILECLRNKKQRGWRVSSESRKYDQFINVDDIQREDYAWVSDNTSRRANDRSSYSWSNSTAGPSLQSQTAYVRTPATQDQPSRKPSKPATGSA